MKTKAFITAACAAFFGPMAPALAATVSVVHGINGLDVGTAREFPVDIAVNGACSLQGVNFTQSALVNLAPARYTITVHPSDGSCSQPAVISKRLLIKMNKPSYSVVASLSSKGKPQLKAFEVYDDLLKGEGYAMFRHLAKTGEIKINLALADGGAYAPKTFKNGEVKRFPYLSSFKYLAVLSSPQTKRILTKFSGSARSGPADIFNIVGSRANGFTVIRETFRR